MYSAIVHKLTGENAMKRFVSLLTALPLMLSASVVVAQNSPNEICAGSSVPQGWIVVNDDWNPMTCGRPSIRISNVWLIERYNNKPVGWTMSVCSTAPTPYGWVETQRDWSSLACGRPSSSYIKNVKQIRRIR